MFRERLYREALRQYAGQHVADRVQVVQSGPGFGSTLDRVPAASEAGNVDGRPSTVARIHYSKSI